MSFKGVGNWLKDNVGPYLPGNSKWPGLDSLNLGKDAEDFDRVKRAEEHYGGRLDRNAFGMPGYNSQYRHYGRLSDQYGNQGSGYVGQQQQLGHILAQEARGQGVGQQLVGMQARQAADRASAQQFGALAGARPGMQAMASRNAMLGSALAQSAVGEQAALGSANMTLGAQQQYGNFLQGARAGDQSQQQINSQAQLEALRQRMLLSQAQQQGAISAEELNTKRFGVAAGQPTQGEITAGGQRDLLTLLMLAGG